MLVVGRPENGNPAPRSQAWQQFDQGLRYEPRNAEINKNLARIYEAAAKKQTDVAAKKLLWQHALSCLRIAAVHSDEEPRSYFKTAAHQTLAAAVQDVAGSPQEGSGGAVHQ